MLANTAIHGVMAVVDVKQWYSKISQMAWLHVKDGNRSCCEIIRFSTERVAFGGTNERQLRFYMFCHYALLAPNVGFALHG